MNDLISREATIEHLKVRLYETEMNSVAEHPYYAEIADNRIDTWVNELPSAQPQCENAYLIDPNPYGECSNCGQLIDIRDEYNYCPNCGADMRRFLQSCRKENQ